MRPARLENGHSKNCPRPHRSFLTYFDDDGTAFAVGQHNSPKRRLGPEKYDLQPQNGKPPEGPFPKIFPTPSPTELGHQPHFSFFQVLTPFSMLGLSSELNQAKNIAGAEVLAHTTIILTALKMDQPGPCNCQLPANMRLRL